MNCSTCMDRWLENSKIIVKPSEKYFGVGVGKGRIRKQWNHANGKECEKPYSKWERIQKFGEKLTR